MHSEGNTKEQKTVTTYVNSVKKEYQAEKAQYQARIKNAKIQSWKQYCNKTLSTNPWNIVYKSAAGKVRSNQITTTLQKDNGSQTEGLRETLQCILEYLIPKDDQSEETEHHKQIRKSIEEPIDTDDRNFTTEEIRQVIKSIDYKKTTGEDGISSKILLWTFERFPLTVTSLYNGCLREGCCPKRWKRTRIIPLIKPGKENCNNASKYRPISLLNTGGKVLEKLLINRIMHFLYKNELLNQNQFGFTPKKAPQRRQWR
jgi:hypothetical protein